MSFTQTTALQLGAGALRQALSEMGLSVSDQAFFWLLGQAYAESGFGLDDMAHMPSGAKNFAFTNNWGAVYCGAKGPKGSVLAAVPTAGCKKGASDSLPGGGTFVPTVTTYASPVEGAKGFVSFVMAIPGVKAVLADGSSTSNDYARALYKAGYFGGFFCGLDGEKSLNQGTIFKSQCEASDRAGKTTAACGPSTKMARATQAEADEMNIRCYALMVDGGANRARKAVGDNPNAPSIIAAGTALTVASGGDTTSTTGRIVKIALFAGALAGIAAWGWPHVSGAAAKSDFLHTLRTRGLNIPGKISSFTLANEPKKRRRKK